MAADAVVADRPGKVAEAGFERRTPLGCLEGAGSGLVRPEEVDERRGAGKHARDGFAALSADQVVGVLPFGKKGEAEALARL